MFESIGYSIVRRTDVSLSHFLFNFLRSSNHVEMWLDIEKSPKWTYKNTVDEIANECLRSTIYFRE